MAPRSPPDSSSSRPNFNKARVVNLEEVLKQRQAMAKAQAKAKSAQRAFTRPRSKHPFIWRVPRVWLRVLKNAKAMAALPLLLAIYNQMILRKKTSVSITSKVWAVAEADTKRDKAALLRALARAPDLVRLEYRHRLRSKYRASQGPLWNAEYPYPDKEDDDDEM